MMWLDIPLKYVSKNFKDGSDHEKNRIQFGKYTKYFICVLVFTLYHLLK